MPTCSLKNKIVELNAEETSRLLTFLEKSLEEKYIDIPKTPEVTEINSPKEIKKFFRNTRK